MSTNNNADPAYILSPNPNNVNHFFNFFSFYLFYHTKHDNLLDRTPDKNTPRAERRISQKLAVRLARNQNADIFDDFW